MGNKSQYLKDVENYFLTLAGKGIMLSSMDYSLIMQWNDRNIPKEVVFKGINKAFEKRKLIDGDSESSIRNIKQCKDYVEETIVEYSPILDNKDRDSNSEAAQNSVIQTLNSCIASENDNRIREYYEDIKNRLASLDDEDLISQISSIEEECLEKLFNNLDNEERDKIISDAREKLGNRARQMTDVAIEESILSFRNEILSSKFNLKSILSLTEDGNG